MWCIPNKNKTINAAFLLLQKDSSFDYAQDKLHGFAEKAVG
jgi:hypothetical protein